MLCDHDSITNSSSESRTITSSREVWRWTDGGFPRCVVAESVEPLLSLSVSEGRVLAFAFLFDRAMSIS